MKDQFDRQITYMRVSVTDRCNLRCVYCMPADGVQSVSHDEILRFDEIERIVRIGAGMGISRIKLTGGEPLVRRGIEDLVGIIKQIPGIEQVTLTTNGVLLSDKINKLVSNGLDAVNISLDTLDREKYRAITRCGCLEEALEGLDAACRYPGLAVRVNCVPLKGTDDSEYIRLARLAEKRKIDVRFIEMMPIGMGKDFAGRSGADIFSLLTGRFGEPETVKERVGNGPAVYVKFPEMTGRIGFISAVSHKFCGSCNRIRLTSEGVLKPCLQYGTGADLRTLLRKKGGTDDSIRREMEKVICEKPEGHCFGEKDTEVQKKVLPLEEKEMSQIGG